MLQPLRQFGLLIPILLWAAIAWAAIAPAQPAEPDLKVQAAEAMKRAATFYRSKVASHGGYVYHYSEDLSERWGEGAATVDTIFVQPPGTPTVGMAYLDAWHATGDPFHLQAARETAMALVNGQLESGGWAQVIHFGPARRLGKYRTRKGGSWNASSLDDGQTQSALEFLFRVDQALELKDGPIHEAALYGLRSLLKAQFANGAFPQVWTGPAAPRPILKAAYPDHDWKTEGKVKNYHDLYTLNDDLARTVADTLIAAHRIYKDEQSLAALHRLGGFLILARMPDPQPAWCQQYDYEMRPAWARKFEPPAIAGAESQSAMETLIAIARHTSDRKYLEPIPSALGYLQKNLLPDGRLARFYELKTSRPLYMDADYQLTYDDRNAPAHYGWKQASRLDRIRKAHDAALKEIQTPDRPPAPPTAARQEQLAPQVRRIIQSLDAQGRWVSTFEAEKLTGQPKFKPGFRYISSDLFARNMATLGDYIAAGKIRNHP